MFTHHKLVRDDAITIIELYLDRAWTEFAREHDGAGEEYGENIQHAIKKYMEEKLPHVKVNIARIMLGSIMVASIPMINAHSEGSGIVRQISPSVAEYIVLQGDTLFRIAQRFETTIEILKSINGLKGDVIRSGQKLILPAEKKEIYVVQHGDSLYGISKKLGTTVHGLMKDNGLESEVIVAGQWLRVTMERQRIHEVKRGDTLYNIGLKYGVSANGMTAANGLQGETLYPGQRLIVPRRGMKFMASKQDGMLAVVNKTYSLTSGYAPDDMVVPEVPFTSKEYSDKKLLRKEAARALEQLFQGAKKDGLTLYAISGYRSYERQEAIFAGNTAKYGSEEAANQFSARAGESEHQTGLAMDVTSQGVNYAITQAFDQSPEGKWLKENAPQYGFIIRYPKGMESVTGYQYEPWHIRYVGVEHAKTMAARGVTLEQYTGKL